MLNPKASVIENSLNVKKTLRKTVRNNQLKKVTNKAKKKKQKDNLFSQSVKGDHKISVCDKLK